MVISEGEAEILAWKCSTLTPLHNGRVDTHHTMDTVPSWWNIQVDYDLEPSLIRVSVNIFCIALILLCQLLNECHLLPWNS